jgi:CBS domain-containing protein
MMMTVRAICSQEVITVQRDATVLHAAMLMRQYHVGDVVVVKKLKDKIVPVGIVTDRDLVIEVVATELDCNVITVGDIMVTSLTVVKDSASVLEALHLMTNKGVRRLPVIDSSGNLIGIVTLDDLLLLFAKEIGLVSKLVTREQKNETAKRR